MIYSSPSQKFWSGKRVLVTGHTGFKGGWLVLLLRRLGAVVSGIGLAPITNPNLFTLANIDTCCDSYICDIRDRNNLEKYIHSIKPEIVFHLAAQPLVHASYLEPVETFDTNIMGTVHVLEALRHVSNCRAAVMITTDKVYENLEWLWPYRESDAIGGHDPYSSSKAACEIIIASYRKAFFNANGVGLASARAGNVIGGGDWSANRLLPDAIRAWADSKTVEIRNPVSTRPWQHVLEPLSSYMVLAEKLWSQPDFSGAWNFGPSTGDTATVQEVINIASKVWGDGSIRFGEDTRFHEARHLSLDTSKSSQLLNVRPMWSLRESVQYSVLWYKNLFLGIDARSLCEADIAKWEAGR